jgi:hypothetical protein
MITVTIASVVALGLVSLRDRERIVSLESRIAALENQPLRLTKSLPLQKPELPLESDGFGPVRVVP